MKVLVVTVVHRPDDARVHGRQIAALLAAGHEVTLVAPWSASGVEILPGVTPMDVPRAAGPRRLRALWGARRHIRNLSDSHDIVLIHDLELLLVAGPSRSPVVWDVHEDVAAALIDKPWVPRLLRRGLARLVHSLERLAERRARLILAEEAYSARFRRPHPVVPNEPIVPDRVARPGDGRVVHLGRHSVGRGLAELIEVGESLPGEIVLELLGWADVEVEPALRQATERGSLVWAGAVPNREALSMIEGALAGLSLLHDLPNYRHSRPTKIVEYMSRGVPVITTPLPVGRELVERHDCGIVVPFEDPLSVVAAITTLAADDELRDRLGRNGHEAARAHYNWTLSGPSFVRLLEGWARDHGPTS